MYRAASLLASREKLRRVTLREKFLKAGQVKQVKLDAPPVRPPHLGQLSLAPHIVDVQQIPQVQHHMNPFAIQCAMPGPLLQGLGLSLGVQGVSSLASISAPGSGYYTLYGIIYICY